MRHEPALDRRALAEVLRAAYGLDARSMAFVPVGSPSPSLRPGSASTYGVQP
jgi:hypothetical protein